MTEEIKPDTETPKDRMEKLVEDSKGTLKKPTSAEMDYMNGSFEYVNKFLCAVLKNNMIKLGFSLENFPATDENPENSAFVCAVMTDIQSIANLHQLLTQVLTAFQKEQMKQMQALQGKVNPNFVEQIKAAQEAGRAN